jgi:alkylated DNA nucleotide flippase Atl1
MQAHEITFFKLIEGDKQFQVPLYQRTYSWQHKDWTRLWEDVLEQVETLVTGEQRTPHFIGSVVLAPGKMAAGDIQRWLVVDGQQRLTTLMLACCALRDRFAEVSPKDAERVHKQYLVNEYREGDEHYRLLPTQADRESFMACVDRGAKAGGSDNVGGAYRFFREELIAYDEEGDLESLKRVETVLRGRLSVVEITADHGDNVYRIFESLNNTGVKLSQTDLLRNYVFMLLPTLAERVYTKVWLPMQAELGSGNLELLAWLDLVIRGDYRVKQTEVYRTQQERLDTVVKNGGEDALEQEIIGLRRRGRLLLKIVEPLREDHAALRAVLDRLREWGGQIVYPIALHLLDQVDRKRATGDEAARALTYIESYLVRRMICRVPTNNLNRVLHSAPKELEDDRPVDEAVHRYLSGPRRGWPSDKEIREAIRNKPFYWLGRSAQRFFVLKRLEQSYDAKEPVDFEKAKLTIEHVMPQTLTKEWFDLLSAEVTDEPGPSELHDELIHTLGNLTLSAENSKLSNHPFQRKQQILNVSALRMNQEIAETPGWGKKEILARAEALTERALGLWPAPLAGGAELEDDRRTWVLLRRLLTAIPSGRWTTFGDLATVIGVRAGAVGGYMSGRPSLENGHRVLTSEGAVSDAFQWPEGHTESVRDVLEREGVDFAASGAADPGQRLSSSDLAKLVGMETDSEDDEWENRADLFEAKLSVHGPDVTAAVVEVVEHWVTSGGKLDFGSSADIGCVPWLDRPDGNGWIWPLVFYSGGKVEVVFQHLSKRRPFDDVALRRELLSRLNRIDGVDIPESKLQLRPSFAVAALLGDGARRLIEALDWFMDQVDPGLRRQALDDQSDAANLGDVRSDGMTADQLATEFHRAMVKLYERAKDEAGYPANYFLRMVSDLGGVEAAKQLLAVSHVSDGFTALWERGRLDLSVEAHVLDPRWAPLFTEEEIQTARRWLEEFGYDGRTDEFR